MPRGTQAEAARWLRLINHKESNDEPYSVPALPAQAPLPRHAAGAKAVIDKPTNYVDYIETMEPDTTMTILRTTVFWHFIIQVVEPKINVPLPDGEGVMPTRLVRNYQGWGTTPEEAWNSLTESKS